VPNQDINIKRNPTDRDKGFPKGTSKFQRRFFEVVPGFLTWTLLLLPFIFALLGQYTLFVIYVSFIVAYWSVRTVKFITGIWIGTRRMKRDLALDWVEMCKRDNPQGYEKLKFIYLCPVYSEPFELLDKSFEAFSKSDVGASKIDVVMAMEERKEDLQIENFKRLKEKYGKLFNSMQYYVHPTGIPEEIVGVKGANINWAMRHHVEKMESEGKDIHEYLLVTCDSDLRPTPKYLSAIAYKYLTVSEPDNRYYATAVHSFNNNIWQAPHIIRIQSSMLTLVLLQNWVTHKKRRIPFTNEEVYVLDSFSSYVVNLKTLKSVQFWDPEIANDDTAFYWNAMVRTKGTFKSEEVYIPTHNDAVLNDSYVKSHKAFYKQQYRWGWGIVNAPITLSAIYQDKKFPLYRKLSMFGLIFEHNIWYLTIVFILTFGLQIMNIDKSFQFTAISYNLPQLMSVIFTLITLSNIPIVIFRRMITPIPKGWKWYRHLLDFIETLLITVNMLTFGFIPYIQAQTEMMLGLSKFKRNFYVTEKSAPKS
jgi:hypothetical protein